MNAHTQTAGFALIEALVAAAIISGVLAFSIGAYLIAAQTSARNGASVEATYLADEGIEAVRVLRDKGWTSTITPLTVGTTYYLAWSSPSWTTTSTNTFIDGTFERTLVLSSVYRDANSDIATAGTLDANARKVTITVSWNQQGATTSRALSAYITNILNN